MILRRPKGKSRLCREWWLEHQSKRYPEGLRRKKSDLTDIDVASNMVDIYEIAPQDRTSRSDEAAANYTFAGQEARMARYQNLLTKLSAHDGPTAAAVAGRVDWDANEDEEAEPHDNVIVKVEADDGPLVGTFGEAAAAMR